LYTFSVLHADIVVVVAVVFVSSIIIIIIIIYDALSRLESPQYFHDPFPFSFIDTRVFRSKILAYCSRSKRGRTCV